jgi:transcriptional regulator with XRE-family HTH domain
MAMRRVTHKAEGSFKTVQFRDKKRGGSMATKNSLGDWQGRLREAREKCGMSIHKLSEKLKEKKEKDPDFALLRSISSGGVHHYLNAKNFYNPRRDTLTAMAKVLGVRPEWLLFNDGPPTEEELRQQEKAEWKKMANRGIVAVATGEGVMKLGDIFGVDGIPSPYVLADRVYDELKIPSRDVPPPWIWSLIEVATRMEDPGGIGAAFERIGDALATMAKAMKVTPASMTDLDGFVFSAVPGLLALAREKRDEANG